MAVRLDFPWRGDGRHDYCVEVGCHAETVERVCRDGADYFHCHTCGRRNARRIAIDPGIEWWVAEDGEYWHESAGVFVRDRDHRFLFFTRAVYPADQLTVPSGHVDAGETAETAAVRELGEEVGWRAPGVRHVASADIVGDSCRRGADAHRWHAYLAVVEARPAVRLNGEGAGAEWLTRAEALARNLTTPVRYMMEHHLAADTPSQRQR
ncbi:MAG TPA: NUDIX hydrolase [Pseudonocardiaceae bacterium]|nr:NUDIX hydrolase [Pseudonocardiaceae bacterium]